MNRITRNGLLVISCLALSVGMIGCGDDDDDENGTGGAVGTGGSGGTDTGAGGDGGGNGDDCETVTVSVDGTVALNPLSALGFGEGVDLEGLTIRVVDPVLSLQGSPDAVLAETNTGTNGAFSFTDVDVTDVQIGAVVTVDGDGVVPSTMALCFPEREDTIEACLIECTVGSLTPGSFTAFVVPEDLNAALQTGLGDEELLTDGYVLGVAGSTDLSPMTDVAIDAGENEVTYLDTDFSALEDATGTGTIGAFLVQPTGQPTLVPSRADTTFQPENQQVGRSAGVAFQVFFLGTE